jgi:hypothetical protein
MHSAEARPKAQNRIHKEKMRPAGRILTYMPFDFEMFGRISAEQRIALMLNSEICREVEILERYLQ